MRIYRLYKRHHITIKLYDKKKFIFPASRLKHLGQICDGSEIDLRIYCPSIRKRASQNFHAHI